MRGQEWNIGFVGVTADRKLVRFFDTVKARTYLEAHDQLEAEIRLHKNTEEGLQIISEAIVRVEAAYT